MKAIRSLLLVFVLSSLAFAEQKSVVITRPIVIPDAAVVGMFDGIERGTLDVRLVLQDESAGHLMVKNLSRETLTVQLPEAFVGVHVLNQFLPPGGNQGFQAGVQQGGQQLGQTLGAGQMVGGGANTQNSSASGQTNPFQNGFFSVPPEKTVQVPVNGVCLEHGRPTPTARMPYRVVPVEAVSGDPLLKKVLVRLASEETPQKIAQAAAWHLASGKSRNDLAAMMTNRVGVPHPYFSEDDLSQTEKLLKDVRSERKEATVSPAIQTVSNRTDAATNLPSGGRDRLKQYLARKSS